MMEYKGYVADIEFDDSVGRLHGRVVNSGAYPIATFEATDVVGLLVKRMASNHGGLSRANSTCALARSCTSEWRARPRRAT